MVLLCFVLDLRSLSPSLLRDLKQSLLQVANFYATSMPNSNRSKSKQLLDRIVLYYVIRSRLTGADELKIAYAPQGNFSLRDFHHAVHNLPTDAFSPDFHGSGLLCCGDLKLSEVIKQDGLYSWGRYDKVFVRRVIVISSYVIEDLDASTRELLLDAADKCISVEFIFFEQKCVNIADFPAKLNKFSKEIAELENCSFRSYFPDAVVLLGLVRKWLQDLKEDMEEPIQARLIFKINLVNSLNELSCNLSMCLNHIMDEIVPCQTCRCHGLPLERESGSQTKKSICCPLSGNELGAFDLIENSLRIGEHTILFMPSFQMYQSLQQISAPVDFSIIQRTSLGSLSEGPAYVVTPSICGESYDSTKSELNYKVFRAVCGILNSLDQGLICSTSCNIETAKETSFQCYYILLPSTNGMMLLRRVAGSEEVLPMPDVSQLICTKESKEIEDEVQASLLKMKVSDYDPMQHERGFHHRLNFLVKESLQFGVIPLKRKEGDMESNFTRQNSSGNILPPPGAFDLLTEEGKQSDLNYEDKVTASVAEEWEKLVVTEVPKIKSPSCISKPKLDAWLSPILSPSQSRPPGDKTSRILERLEGPRQLKRKTASPSISCNVTSDANELTKKPLLSHDPIHSSDQSKKAGPMKPNFQRLKRKGN